MRKVRGSALATRASSNRDRLAAIGEVAASLGGWKQADQIVREDECVPTIFPLVDYRLELGGFPISRISLVHGPSSEGKTPFGLGVLRSFLELDHFAAFIDAERSTGKKWLRTLLGSTYDHPGFSMPESCRTYEQTRVAVRVWCETIGAARAKGKVPPDTTGVILVDSIKKLMPENLWNELGSVFKDPDKAEKGKGKGGGGGRKKKPKGHIDGVGGRAGQIKALYNSAWADELVPLLADTRTAMVIISRESIIDGEGFFADDVVQVGGGRNLLYDSSLWLRVLDSPVWVGPEGQKQLIGRRHSVEIRRSKIGARRVRMPTGAYHTSLGITSPDGFDRVRDVFELGTGLGVIDQAGAHYKFDGAKLGQGEENAIAKMREGDLATRIELACRAEFPNVKKVTV